MKDKKPINCFPGYTFEDALEVKKRKNMYRGVDVSLGGYVYAEPGMYRNVALIDAASLHPTSIILLNKLGEYTKRYADLRNARVFIKHKDYESASKLFDGKLKKYLTSDEEADALSKALKLPINAFFGMSFANFSNPARDVYDRNNIIALRGALFMKTLQDEVAARGYKVVHIKTDSIKIADSTPEIISFVQEFGEKYGYEMEHEATYDRMCLVNDAVYIAKYDEYGIRNKGGKHANEWTATGAEFQHPYIFKTLFSKEPIEFRDMCETKSISGDGAMYLDMNKNLVRDKEEKLIRIRNEIAEFPKGQKGIMALKKEAKLLDEEINSVHNYIHVGKCGSFVPVDETVDGGILVRSLINKMTGEKRILSVAGTKGYRWLEAEEVIKNSLEDHVDKLYFRKLIDDTHKHLSKYGDVEEFIYS